MARRQPPARTTQISELSLYDAGNCEALRSSRTVCWVVRTVYIAHFSLLMPCDAA